jgi:hypothetical protein
MRENLTRQDFAEHLNTKFRIILEDSSFVELEMVEAKAVGSATGQEQFSVVFRGALNFFINQGNYVLEHEQLGTVLLFLVPVGKQEDGFYYEAAFNRLARDEGKKEGEK